MGPRMREDTDGGLGLEVGDDGFEGLDGLVYVGVGVGEGGVEFLGALEDSVLLDEVAETGFDCVVGGQGGAIVGERVVGEDDVEDGVFAGCLGGDFGLSAEIVQGVAESSSQWTRCVRKRPPCGVRPGWRGRRRRRRDFR